MSRYCIQRVYGGCCGTQVLLYSMWPVTTKKRLLSRTCSKKKLRFCFYLKQHFISSKMIPFMCKFHAALEFYGQKQILICFISFVFSPHKWTNILKCIEPTSALFWCDGSRVVVKGMENCSRYQCVSTFRVENPLTSEQIELHAK